MYKIEIHKEALKFLHSLPEGLALNILEKIKALENDPYPPGVIKVKGREETTFRMRIGKYRVLYFIDKPASAIYIMKIDKRGTVYD